MNTILPAASDATSDQVSTKAGEVHLHALTLPLTPVGVGADEGWCRLERLMYRSAHAAFPSCSWPHSPATVPSRQRRTPSGEHAKRAAGPVGGEELAGIPPPSSDSSGQGRRLLPPTFPSPWNRTESASSQTHHEKPRSPSLIDRVQHLDARLSSSAGTLSGRSRPSALGLGQRKSPIS